MFKSFQTDAGSLRRQLFAQTWPMTIGVVSLLGMQLVDSTFIAHLGTQPLAAQSFTFPITFLMIGVQVGLGIAIAALISRTLGSGDIERSRRLGSLVLQCGAAIVGVLAISLWSFHNVIFEQMGAQSNVRALISAYWAPQLLANWLGALLYFGYTLFRAHGNTRVPGSLMVLTSLLNLGLDPLLIFGVGDWHGLGLPGAAMATISAFTIGLLVLGMRLAGRHWLAAHGLLAEIRHSARPFAVIAGPALISQLMPPLAALLATGMLASLGEPAVAAWGLLSRLETVSLMVVLGLTMSLPPWLGHCYGAGNWSRIRALIRIAGQTVVVWQLTFGLVMAVAAPWIAPLFSQDAAVIGHLDVLLRVVLPSYALLGLCMLVVSASNALGWPVRAMLVSFARLFVCYLPCIGLGVLAGSVTYVAAGAAVGNIAAGLMAWTVLRANLEQAPAGGVPRPA